MNNNCELRMRLRRLLTVVVAVWLAGVAGLPTAHRVVGQDGLVPKSAGVEEVCPDIHVRAGEIVPLDCSVGFEPGSMFEWTSPDASALDMLNETTARAAQFTAPAGIRQSRTYLFYRTRLGASGDVLGRTEVQVVVYPAWTSDCLDVDGLPLKGQARLACAEASGELTPDARDTRVGREDLPEVHVLSQDWPEEQLELRCERSVTVEAAGETIVPCTSASSAVGLLKYTARFDWPPYSETVVLESGEFEYVVKAPVHEDAAAVRRLELTVEDLSTGLAASQEIEVHVVNAGPVLRCFDLVVQEGDRVRIPCVASGSAGTRYQLFLPGRPGGMPRGLFEELPAFTAPEVDRDTTLTVLVRALDQAAGRVAQQEFSLLVRDADAPSSLGPPNLTIECDPAMSEVYEGDPDIRIECTITSGQDGAFFWAWAAEGDTPLELIIDSIDLNAPEAITFEVPESVDEDKNYEYSVVASHDDHGFSNRVSIYITVLERPDIAITCQDARARTGDPPRQLECTATNDKGVDRMYYWVWGGPLHLLRAEDLTLTGTPLFVVPGSQAGLSVDYVYTVSASAENADPPPVPATLTVTVETILGTLSVSCVTPVEVFEGANDVELDCSVGGAQPGAEITWVLQPQSGSPDLLSPNPDPGGGPIFSVPPSIPADQTYEYSVGVAAPNYIASEEQIVTIRVLTRPELALNCESRVTVFVADPPRRLFCEASNDRDLDLEYRWEWTPETRLEDADTATPRFEVPTEQRESSVKYPHLVTVSAPEAIPASAPVEVTVLNPDVSQAFQVAVSTTGMDLGSLGSSGVARLDPTTELVSGRVHGGAVHAARMLIAAQDSITVGLELLRSVVLRRSGVVAGADASLELVPLWAYAGSCATLAPEMVTEFQMRVAVEEGDCRLLRFGGELDLTGAAPGSYSGELAVVLSLGSLDETYEIPVWLVVEDERRVVSIGPDGASFGTEAAPSAALDPNQTIRIHPLVASLARGQMEGVMDVSNPSVVPLEVSVTARFGYLEAQSQGDFVAGGGSVMVADPNDSPLGNLAERLTLYPGEFLLLPGETRQVRYGVETAQRGQMGDRGYAAFLGVAAAPRQYVRQDQLPASVTNSSAARVSTSIPAVYIPGASPARLTAVLESSPESLLQGQGATFLIETAGEPFAGHVVVSARDGEELGRSDLLVYTRSRVRVPLSGLPGATLMLHFVSSTDAPAPGPILLSTGR